MSTDLRLDLNRMRPTFELLAGNCIDDPGARGAVLARLQQKPHV